MRALRALAELNKVRAARLSELNKISAARTELNKTRAAAREEKARAEMAALITRAQENMMAALAKIQLPELPNVVTRQVEAIEALSQPLVALADSFVALAGTFAQIHAAMAEVITPSGPAQAEFQATQEDLVRHLRVGMLSVLAATEAGRSHWEKAEEYHHDARHDLEEAGAR